MKLNIFKDFYFYIIILITIFSFFIGLEYSKYHTDIHHWSFILESLYEYQMGQKLYKDIFLQYGHGLTVFLNTINYFFTINFYSIGIVSSFFFSIKFIFLYLICKKNNLSGFLSFLFTILIFSLLTHAQVPWPDFFSGTFLIIFFYLMFLNEKKQNLIVILITSFFLFLTIFFRNTYLLNFVLCIMVYFFIGLFSRNLKSDYLNKIIIYTAFYVLIFFITLGYENVLYLWFEQGFYHSTNYLGVTEKNIIFNLDRYFFIILRLLWHLLVPKNLFNASFTICFIICLFLLIKYLFSEINSSKKNQKKIILIFLIIYGFAGLIQNLNKFEILRFINASISLYFVSFLYLSNFLNNKNFNKIILFLILFIYLFIINLNFPKSSNFFEIKQNNNLKYKKSNNEYFGKKQFTNDYIVFYKKILNNICSSKNIYNFSFDRTLNYQCILKSNKVSLFDTYIDYKKIIEENSIIISHEIIPDLKIKSKFKIPKFYRYTESDVFFKFYPEYIFIYEKN